MTHSRRDVLKLLGGGAAALGAGAVFTTSAQAHTQQQVLDDLLKDIPASKLKFYERFMNGTADFALERSALGQRMAVLDGIYRGNRDFWNHWEGGDAQQLPFYTQRQQDKAFALALIFDASEQARQENYDLSDPDTVTYAFDQAFERFKKEDGPRGDFARTLFSDKGSTLIFLGEDLDGVGNNFRFLNAMRGALVYLSDQPHLTVQALTDVSTKGADLQQRARGYDKLFKRYDGLRRLKREYQEGLGLKLSESEAFKALPYHMQELVLEARDRNINSDQTIDANRSYWKSFAAGFETFIKNGFDNKHAPAPKSNPGALPELKEI